MRGTARTVALLSVLGGLANLASAQDGGAKSGQVTKASAEPQSPWITLSKYDEKTSRAAFRACDVDGDDRLEVREARTALPNMGGPENPAGFRALDANRDGFVHWNEFDGRFRSLITKRAKFVFRPTQPFVQRKPKPVDRVQLAVEKLLAMASDDDDPIINKSEFTKLLAKLKQPAAFANSFPALDIDKSGGLSADELKPVVAQIPVLLNLADEAPKGTAAVSVSPADLRMRLNRMHPALGRWSRKIFQTADRDKNGKLSGKEIDPSEK